MFKYKAPDSTSLDYMAREQVFNLVKKHFSLNVSSLKYFEEELFTPSMDEVFVEILGEDNVHLRRTIPIKGGDGDESWGLYKILFSFFVNKHAVTFENFLDNKITIGNNSMKLFKATIDYYSKKENYTSFNFSNGDTIYDLDSEDFEKTTRKFFEEKIAKVVALKGASANNLIFSANFVDFFFCSTDAAFTSCLSLNSHHEGAFWAGIPGLIGDKNKCIVFTSEGKTVTSFDIMHEQMKSRTFVALSSFNEICDLRWYPSKPISSLANVLPFSPNYKVKDLNDICFVTKNKLTILRNKNGNSLYPYCDHIGFDKSCKSLKKGYSGFCYFDENNDKQERLLYVFDGGLKTLVSRNEEIVYYEEEEEERIFCYACDDEISEDETYEGSDGHVYCQDCFNDRFGFCEKCGEVNEIDNLISFDGALYCEDCLDTIATECDDCGELVSNDEISDRTVIGINGRKSSQYICNSCLNNYVEDRDGNLILEDKSIEVKIEFGTTYVHESLLYKLYFDNKEEKYYYYSDLVKKENNTLVPEWEIA